MTNQMYFATCGQLLLICPDNLQNFVYENWATFINLSGMYVYYIM